MKPQMWPFVIAVIVLVAIPCCCMITDFLRDVARNRRDGI